MIVRYVFTKATSSSISSQGLCQFRAMVMRQGTVSWRKSLLGDWQIKAVTNVSGEERKAKKGLQE